MIFCNCRTILGQSTVTRQIFDRPSSILVTKQLKREASYAQIDILYTQQYVFPVLRKSRTHDPISAKNGQIFNT